MSKSNSLDTAKEAIKQKNDDLARSILATYLYEHPQSVDAWLLMAQVATEPDQIMDCLERIHKLGQNTSNLGNKLKRIKEGPLKYYHQVMDVIRGYGQWGGQSSELGNYAVSYKINNNFNELKELLATVRKQQRHLQELKKLIDRDEATFNLIPLDEQAPTYDAESNLYLSTSKPILMIYIMQALGQFEKVVLDLEIRIEKKTKEIKPSYDTISRLPIPDDVKMFVWQRDKGRCVKYSSQINLEFDHVIPVSKGGSNTARNIQLLCEACNRKKSNNIA